MTATLPPPLQFLLLLLVGWVSREQQAVILYLQAENATLREQLGPKRLRFTQRQRRRLAERGQALGRALLGRYATPVTPDTILRWYRRLVAQRYTARNGDLEETTTVERRIASDAGSFSADLSGKPAGWYRLKLVKRGDSATGGRSGWFQLSDLTARPVDNPPSLQLDSGSKPSYPGPQDPPSLQLDSGQSGE